VRFNERLLFDAGISKADIATLRQLLLSITTLTALPTMTITASPGGSQANAVEINKDVAIIDVVATLNDSVKLPIGEPGFRVFVLNRGVNTCRVYPAAGGDVGSGVDVPYILAPATNVTFLCYASNAWDIV